MHRKMFKQKVIIAYAAIIILGILLLHPISPAKAQTCSCAGSPLITSQSIGSTSQGKLLLGLTYEYNNISDLYSGDTQLDNTNQRLNTTTALFEANYGLTERLALTGTITYNRKYRETGLQTPGDPETLTTSGIGDGLLLLKYNVKNQTIWDPYHISVGGGVKIPFGSTSLKSNGFTLNADMQPGTGAWDGLLWGYASRTFKKSNRNIFTMGTYRRTGVNERFNSTDRYRFGNELILILGTTGPIAGRWSYAFMLRYRSSSSDRRNGAKLPSTGGKWVKLKPNINYQLSDRFNLQLSGQLPVYQRLKGTQPTTSFILSGSVFYMLGKKNEGIIGGELYE